jgi:hypothetical protein
LLRRRGQIPTVEKEAVKGLYPICIRLLLSATAVADLRSEVDPGMSLVRDLHRLVKGKGRVDMTTKKKWSRKIRTVSTYPPKGLFTKNAQTIARRMASKRVSPKGIGSGIRMIQMFINRAGKNLPAERRRELEKAKRILQAKRKAA